MNPLQFYCNQEGHDQSVIIGVCLDKSCIQNRGYCVYCQAENHSSHFQQLKPFRDFYVLIQHKIEIYQIINEQIQELQKVVNQFLEFSQAININDLQLENLSQQQLKELVDKNFYIEEFQNQLSDEIYKTNQILNENAKILKEILGKKQFSQSNNKIQKIDMLVNQTDINDKSFRFADYNLFGAKTIEGNKKLCTQLAKCVVEIRPPIQKNTSQKIQMYFETGSDTYFGIISNLNSSMNNISFDSKTASNLNAYLINQEGKFITPNGITSSFQINIFKKKFSIAFQQKLLMEVNYQAGKLTWTNLNTGDSTSVNIDKSFEYYFCAGGQNTTLTIIDFI